MRYCKHCGESVEVHLFLALMIALGCQTQDPNYCYASEDHQHEYVKRGEDETTDAGPNE